MRVLLISMAVVALAACGGNVVVDGAGVAPGSGGATASTGTTSGTGGTGTTSGCENDGCHAAPNGFCNCTGSCSNDDTPRVYCQGGNIKSCDCFLNDKNVGTCVPGPADSPCGSQFGCCAQFF